jgi:hypothetical protein
MKQNLQQQMVSYEPLTKINDHSQKLDTPNSQYSTYAETAPTNDEHCEMSLSEVFNNELEAWVRHAAASNGFG